MTARQFPSESERIVANLPVTAAAEEFIFAIQNAVKFLAVIEKLRRGNEPAAEAIIRSRPDDDEPRYSLFVIGSADDTDGGEPFKYTLSLTNYVSAERQAFHNAVRAFPGVARSSARPIAQKARDAFLRAWRDARARDIADEEEFNRQCFVAYCQRCEAERLAKRTLRRERKKQEALKVRARTNRMAGRHAG
jgi:hypothetical protein